MKEITSILYLFLAVGLSAADSVAVILDINDDCRLDRPVQMKIDEGSYCQITKVLSGK